MAELALSQTADGSPDKPNPSEKFIFYWGTAQATLTADNQYRAKWTLKPQEFRQMLLRAPYLWNGRAMAERMTFRLNGAPVVATRSGGDYETLAVHLYERFSGRIAGGQRFDLTDLALTPERVGAITIHLEEPPAASAGDASPLIERYPISWLDHNTLADVQWGLPRHEVNQRDFFSLREALEILHQQPAIEWQPYVSAQPVYADIQITDVGGARHGTRVLLSDPNAYQQIARYVERYRFLLQPGARVTLTLYSNQYDRLYEHILRIVSDNDPRLALRRYRDAHRARLQWGAIAHEWEGVYLTRLEDANGTPLPTDLPYTVRFSLASASRPDLLAARPTLWVDDVRVTDLSFSLSAGGQTVRMPPEDALPALPPPAADDMPYTVHLSNLEAAGYDLSALNITVTFVPVQTPLSPPNTSLRMPPALTLFLPVVSAEAAEITFDLPETTTLSLVVEDSRGTPQHQINGLYSAGRHTLSLPRHLLPKPGNYAVLLKTPYGEARQLLEMR